MTSHSANVLCANSHRQWLEYLTTSIQSEKNHGKQPPASIMTASWTSTSAQTSLALFSFSSVRTFAALTDTFLKRKQPHQMNTITKHTHTDGNNHVVDNCFHTSQKLNCIHFLALLFIFGMYLCSVCNRHNRNACMMMITMMVIYYNIV